MKFMVKDIRPVKIPDIRFSINDSEVDITVVIKMQDIIDQNIEAGLVIIKEGISYCYSTEQVEALERLENIYDAIWGIGEFDYRYTEYAYSMVLRDGCIFLEDREKIYYACKNKVYPYFAISKNEDEVKDWLKEEIDSYIKSGLSEQEALSLYEYNINFS